MKMLLRKRQSLAAVICFSQLLWNLLFAEETSTVVTVSPESQKVKELGLASFLCHVSSEMENYRVSWFKGDRQITEKNLRYLIANMARGSVLRVFPARKRDEGSYECRVSNEEQTLTASGQLGIYADGKAPPGFPEIRDLSTKVIEKNHNDILQCIANGDPAPTISWLKDYLPINLTNPRIKSIPGGKLQIERAQESDMGKYECVATNGAGVAHSNGAHVYVKERSVPPHFSRQPENVEVKPGGSVNLTCVAIGSPMPYVKWLHGAEELTPPGSLPPIGLNILRLNNVMESTTYTCEASSTLGIISAQAEVRLKDLPKPPVAAVIAEVTSDSVTISWNSGNDDISESYIIRYKLRSSADDTYLQVTDITDTEYTVSELVPFTAYVFQVMAVNSIGISTPSEMLELTTHESVPGAAPQNVRARPVSSSTIVVQWDQPSRPNGQIKGYKVYYSLKLDNPLPLWMSVEVDNSPVTTISNLLTNQTYGIKVLAFTNVGSGPPSETITIITQQGVNETEEDNFMLPEQPGNIRGTPLSATSIELSWEPSDAFVKNIESYQIFGSDIVRRRNFTFSVSPPQTTYVVEDLSPNTLYSFRIAAQSLRGMGPLSASTEVWTMESAPSAAPQRVSGAAVDSTTIRISWNPPMERDRNGIITGFRVRYGVTSEDAVLASVPPTETVYVMTNLRKWTQYRIAVLAHTEFGDGPYSDTITVSTAEDVPGEPRRFGVDVINSTAVAVHWRPPARQELNGVIRGYLIYYTPLRDDRVLDGQLHPLNMMNGSHTEAIVAGLMPDTEYQFRISAYTRKGDGLRSRAKKVRTKAAAPRNFQLTLKSSNPPEVLATWDPPESGTSKVAAYRLDYRRFGSEGWSQKTLPADSKSFRSTSTEKLLNGVEYEFRIAAKNNVELGDFANQTIVIPENMPTGPPMNLRYLMWSATKVKIQWDPPPSLSRVSSILYYEISYRLDDDADDAIYQRNSSETMIIAEDLRPSTDFFFQIVACSASNCGPKSEALLVELVEPELVIAEDVQASRTSPEEITVTWKRPEVPPGIVVEYVVYYHSDPLADVSTWFFNDATANQIDTLEVPDPEVTYYVRVRVKLSNETFGPFTDAIEVKSSLDGLHSDIVWNIHTAVEGPTSIRITWSPPKKPGLVSYKLEYEARLQYENGYDTAIAGSKNFKDVSRDEEGVLVDSLRPDTMYVFTVFAKFLDGNYGPPKLVRAKTYEGLAAPAMETRLSDSVARFRLMHTAIPGDSSSNISYFVVVVVPEELALQRNPDTFTMEELNAADDGTVASPWIAAKFGGQELPESLDIGDNSKLGTREFLNRPLSKDRAFRVFVRSVYKDEKSVSSPYSEQLTVDTLQNVVPTEATDSDMQLLWVVAPICAAVVILLLIILAVVFFRRSRRARRTKRLPAVESPLLWPVKNSSRDALEFQQLKLQTQGMASHPPIPIHDLAKHVENLKENDHQKFSQEYESIEPGQQFTWEASNVEVNKTKNRYANVIAYDHSRVTLQPLEGVPGSDYINANVIDGCRKNAYIATQGALPETFGDFWRMVWEQKCQTIVMMTKLEERNRVKCDQYWPNRGTEVYGAMQVTITDVIELASYTVRTFVITKSNSFEKREVRQFQFTAWPDHGVPDHPTPLLTFIRRVKTVAANDVGPTIIHCSAGVGRTGAFIVIDTMLDRLEREKTVDIYGYVTCLRAQRNYMVQTEDQYIFIHEALIEAIESGDTEIPADNLFIRIQHLTQIDQKECVSRMELEFRKISETKMNSSEYLSGSLTVNKLKNRLVHILPYDSSRVCLQSIRGVEGSDYINASFIDGYRNRRSYIATQSPLLDTVDDFWRMLWENNCTIIVMLTKLREMGREKCHQYWPDERSARYQYFVVDPVNQYAMPQFILREFKVTDARDGQSRMVRHFQFMDWPEQGVPSSGEGFIEFIGHIQKNREQIGQDGPIVVHCSTGFGRTGVFLALSIVLEQMRFEGVVDMFQTVKMLRTQRPAMVQTEDQYTFCYRAALEYLSSFDHYAR